MIGNVKRRHTILLAAGLLLSVMAVAWISGAPYFSSVSQPQSADSKAAAVTEVFLVVDVDAAIKEQLETLVDAVRVALRVDRIGYRDLGVVKDQVMFELRDSAQAAAAVQAVSTVFPDLFISEENGRIEIAPTDEAQAIMRGDGLQQTKHFIERNFRAYGAVVEEIRTLGTRCIVVRGVFPEIQHSHHFSRAELSLRLLVGEVDRPQTDVAAGEEVLRFHKNSATNQPIYYAVRKRTVLSGDHIVGTSVDVKNGRPVVVVRVDYSGRTAIAGRLPEPDQRIAVVLDGQVIAIVRVARHPPDQLNLYGDFTMEQAEELADLLTVGIWGLPVEQADKCPD